MRVVVSLADTVAAVAAQPGSSGGLEAHVPEDWSGKRLRRADLPPRAVESAAAAAVVVDTE